MGRFFTRSEKDQPQREQPPAQLSELFFLAASKYLKKDDQENSEEQREEHEALLDHTTDADNNEGMN